MLCPPRLLLLGSTCLIAEGKKGGHFYCRPARAILQFHGLHLCSSTWRERKKERRAMTWKRGQKIRRIYFVFLNHSSLLVQEERATCFHFATCRNDHSISRFKLHNNEYHWRLGFVLIYCAFHQSTSWLPMSLTKRNKEGFPLNLHAYWTAWGGEHR